MKDRSAEPGAKIVQGVFANDASVAERWVLESAGKAFQLRNAKSGLVLEIGSANQNKGVQAIQWQSILGQAHQQWLFEPVEGGYLLRAQHSQQVLGIGQGFREQDGRAVQWDYVPGAMEMVWEVRALDDVNADRPAVGAGEERPHFEKNAEPKGWLALCVLLVLIITLFLAGALGLWRFLRNRGSRNIGNSVG